MTQLDDLTAALTGVSDKVDAVGTQVALIATEVADLLTMLSNLPHSPDLAAAIAQVNGIATKLDGVSAALAAIPPDPAA